MFSKKNNIILLLCCAALLVGGCGQNKVAKNETTFQSSQGRMPDDMSEGETITDSLPEKNEWGEIDLKSCDVSKLDLRNQLDQLYHVSFNSKTIWPKKDKMPKEYNPEQIIKDNMHPGLGIENLHKKGITGKGVGIAIIDQPLLTNHEEYKNQLAYYHETERGVNEEMPSSMHGPAVASIAVGKNVGVAPEANLYFWADAMWEDEKKESYYAQDILEIVEFNKSLPEDQKIRVISISDGSEDPSHEGFQDYMNAMKTAYENNILVITVSLEESGTRGDLTEEGYFFDGAERTLFSDSEDPNSYDDYWTRGDENYIYVPMNGIVVASMTGEKDYAYDSFGGYSWTTPYLAGLYAMACQVNQNVDLSSFYQAAKETAYHKEGHACELGKDLNQKFDMMVIQPEKMIERLSQR